MAAHLLGELARLIIAHIARRRTNQPRYRVLFHILAHVDGDERVHAVEQLGGQLLDQLGLAHAGGTDKNEAGGAVTAGQIGTGALDGLRHAAHRLVLPDDVGLEGVLQPQQAAVFRLLDFDGGDAGPQLHHLRHILQRQLDVRHLQFQLGQTLPLAGQLGLGGGQLLIVDGAVLRVFQRLFLFLQCGHGLLHRQILGDFGMAQVAAGAGFVQQVDGLVGQEPVGDIPLGQLHHGGHQRVRHADAVVLFVVDFDALQHLDGVVEGRLLHLDGLETAFQRGILLDILAVFRKGGGADDLHLSAGQRGLHDVGGVHGAVGIPRAHDVVNFVNEQDHVAGAAHFGQQALDPLLELAPELGAGHKGGQVQQVNFLVL